jgi:hypothetical protein
VGIGACMDISSTQNAFYASGFLVIGGQKLLYPATATTPF